MVGVSLMWARAIGAHTYHTLVVIMASESQSGSQPEDEPIASASRQTLQSHLLPCLRPRADADVKPAPLQEVRVEPPWVGWKWMSQEKYDDIVQQPTPAHRWWTPTSGWPRSVKYAGGCPRDLMPTAPHLPDDFFIPEQHAIGELKVELLETDGLPDQDSGPGANDVYSVLVFEESIARTKTIKNVRNPRWHAECARAFRFPVFAPHSSLFVALFDSDEDDAINSLDRLGRLIDRVDDFASNKLEELNHNALKRRRSFVQASAQAGGDGSVSDSSPRAEPAPSQEDKLMGAPQFGESGEVNIKEDDAIGRVVLDLRELQSGLVYDSWFELRASSVIDDRGTLGALRLRYSVTWRVPTSTLFARYLGPPPEFVIPLGSAQVARAADFALRGNHASMSGEGSTTARVVGGDGPMKEKAFDLKVFIAHGRELKGFVYAVLDYVYGVEDLLTYRRPLRSLVALGIWQAVCLHPTLLPSCVPLALVAVLCSTFGERAAARSLPAAPPAQRRTQADVVRERDAAAALTSQRDLAAAAAADAFESALRGGLAGQVASTVGGAVNSLATEIVGKKAIDYWANDVGRNATHTLQAAGRMVAQEGKVLEATAAVGTRAAKLASKTAATAAKAGVRALRLAVNTAQDLVENMKETVVDPTVAFEGMLAHYLQYYGETLAAVLGKLRGARSVLCWNDAALTTCLFVALVALAAVLPFLPWQLICQTCGFLALGPHMYLVGRQRRAAKQQVDESLARIKAFSTETDARRRARLLEAERQYRAVKEEEERAAADEAARLLPLAEFVGRRRTYCKLLQGKAQLGHVAELRLQGSRVTLDKLAHEPDASRSYAVRVSAAEK